MDKDFLITAALHHLKSCAGLGGLLVCLLKGDIESRTKHACSLIAVMARDPPSVVRSL